MAVWKRKTENIRRFYTRDGSFVSLGTLRSDDGDDNENFKKAIELITKKTILHVHHAFLHISLPSLHDYNVKMPYFTIHRLKYKRRRNFLSLSELEYGP